MIASFIAPEVAEAEADSLAAGITPDFLATHVDKVSPALDWLRAKLHPVAIAADQVRLWLMICLFLLLS